MATSKQSQPKRCLCGRRSGLEMQKLGPCFNCPYQTACWYVSLGWVSSNQVGRHRSDFREAGRKRAGHRPIKARPEPAVMPAKDEEAHQLLH